MNQSVAQVAQINETAQIKEKSLVRKMAEQFGVDEKKFLKTLKATVFKQKNDQEITNEQLMMVMIVADQYNLNPFTKEIYAFPSKEGVVPVVGYDGWIKMVNSHHEFDGVEFIASPKVVQIDDDAKPCPEYITCLMHRKDRNQPIQVTEYLDEVYRPAFKGNGNRGQYTVKGPWQTHTKRQLRTKAYIQAARIGFGLAGIYDPDEAQGILDNQDQDVTDRKAVVIPVETHNQASVQAKPVAIEHKKIDPMVQSLAKRAQESCSWQAAYDYVKGSDRFSHDERDYILDKLKEKERLEAEPTLVEASADPTPESAQQVSPANQEVQPQAQGDMATGISLEANLESETEYFSD